MAGDIWSGSGGQDGQEEMTGIMETGENTSLGSRDQLSLGLSSRLSECDLLSSTLSPVNLADADSGPKHTLPNQASEIRRSQICV